MARRVVYLSGRIANCTYEEATARRNRVTKMLVARDWDVLDPMRGKEILSSLATIDEEAASKLLGVTGQAILQRDYDDLARSNVILNLSGQEPSYGTDFEWAIAHFQMRKPVVVVAPKDALCRTHPWTSNMASYFAETEEEAVDFLDRWFDRGYQLPDVFAGEPPVSLAEGLRAGQAVFDREYQRLQVEGRDAV